MKIEIIKEYHKKKDGVEEKYSIKTTYFKFLKLFKVDDDKLQKCFYSDYEPSLMITLILYHVFILTPTIFLGFIFNFYLIVGGLVVELTILKSLNYHWRKLYDNLDDGEEDVKNLIKLKSLNKKIVQKYTIEHNELIIEKQK